VSRLLKRARAEGVVEIRIIDRDAVVRPQRTSWPGASRWREFTRAFSAWA
jgi:hypothetical protein